MMFFLFWQNEWVICRVFQKGSSGKKTHISGMMRLDSLGNELGSSGLPPLTESSPYSGNNNIKTKPPTESAYVPCFSNPIDAQRNHHGGGIFDSFTNSSLYGVSSDHSRPRIPLSGGGSLYSPPTQTQVQVGLQAQQPPSNLALPNSVYTLQDQTILRALLENHGSNRNNSFKAEREMISVSQETGLTTDMNPEISSVVSSFNHQQHVPASAAASVDFESLWNY